MGTLWLGGQRGWFARNFTQITTSTPPPPWTLPAWRHPPSQNLKNTPTLGHSQAHTPPPLGHCLCDVIIHIPKGLICSFLWPIFSSCFARISPTVCPNFPHCLPEFFGGGGSCPPCPPRLIRLCLRQANQSGFPEGCMHCLLWDPTPHVFMQRAWWRGNYSMYSDITW